MKASSLISAFLGAFCFAFFSGTVLQAAEAKPALPRLVDLGAGKCIPCKQMKPILEELRSGYVGRLEVVFIDVWEQPSQGANYGVRMIPTQIFYSAEGKELARHEGFMSKKDILEKWKSLGVVLDGPVLQTEKAGEK